ncbi:MAG: DUF1592 domain-containing protein [Bryobacteraceae bacterium]|nr:DUF1592 domain-containing protein [Bryobacteraceae bacterium]
MSAPVIRIALFLLTAAAALAQAPVPVGTFIAGNCAGCHNAKVKQGNLDLTSLRFSTTNAENFARWVKIHDRVRDGEMPPPKTVSVGKALREGFLASLSTALVAADKARYATQGRSTLRRMNRYEYENTLRDLLGAPWLQVKEMLPEDGEAHRFNKVGDALDVSHVQMSQYLAAADYALREVLPRSAQRPTAATNRYYARDQGSFVNKIAPPFNERNAFAVVGQAADIEALKKTGRKTVGAANPEVREQEGVGLVCSAYEPVEPRFNQFTAPMAGRYKVRLKAHTMWMGALKGPKWWKPDPENISKGHRDEPVTLYSETPPRQTRRLGSFDVHPEPSVAELEVELLKGESIRPDATRFFRSRPPGDWRNPHATPEGQPGIVYQWLEVEGPLVDEWPTKGQRLLFADLPYKVNPAGVTEFQATDPAVDSRRLLTAFMARAYRHPVPPGDVARFTGLAKKAMAEGFSFTEAMLSAYSGILCSPGFVTLPETPGRLDSYAIASRLSYFLWNTEPDPRLRKLAVSGQLRSPEVLRAQARRLLDDPKSQQFVSAFLDYWLDLRKLNINSPDGTLYGDYYLDDFLVESAGDETRAFFTELVRKNLPARHVVASDFAMINERLAAQYGIEGVDGAAIRRVPLQAESVRGGLLGQASVLKVTANGTTTSPVLRGVWINERILGRPVPPPPPGVPAVEPDTRGTTTIREQLAKHRDQVVCNSCHSRIDPPGFALESFDVAGGFRDKYRVQGDGPKAPGIGKGGHFFEFGYGPSVDASGTLPDGRKFSGLQDFRKLLLADERQIARNLASQLVTYATGAPVRFGDRPQVEAILDRTRNNQFGVGSIIEAIVESDLFLMK